MTPSLFNAIADAEESIDRVTASIEGPAETVLGNKAPAEADVMLQRFATLVRRVRELSTAEASPEFRWESEDGRFRAKTIGEFKDGLVDALAQVDRAIAQLRRDLNEDSIHPLEQAMRIVRRLSRAQELLPIGARAGDA